METERVNSQPDDEEGHGGMLETTVGTKPHVGRVVAAAISRPILGRVDERHEPKVREDEVEWHQMSAVGLDDREDNGKEVNEERQDGLEALVAVSERGVPGKTYDDLIVNEMSAASVMFVEEVGNDACVDGRGRKY